MNHESLKTIDSGTSPGVRFTVRRMTLGRRLDMVSKLKERTKQLEFHNAGDSTQDALSGSLLACEIDRIYLDWGLESIDGLLIDGAAATTASLFDSGPETLCKEIIGAIKSEVFLGHDERKN